MTVVRGVREEMTGINCDQRQGAKQNAELSTVRQIITLSSTHTTHQAVRTSTPPHGHGVG